MKLFFLISSVLVLTFSGASSGLAADRFDPTDDTFEGARKLVVGTTMREEEERTVGGADPADWFSFFAVRGDTYTFCDASSGSDIKYALFDNPSTGTPLADKNPCLSYTPTKAQLLYLRVTGSVAYKLTHKRISSSTGGGGGGQLKLPSCKILRPLRTSKSNTLIYGTSASNPESELPIERVLVRSKIKTAKWSKWRSARGTEAWRARVKTPKKGTTVVQAVSVDSKGKRSPAFTLPVRRK